VHVPDALGSRGVVHLIAGEKILVLRVIGRRISAYSGTNRGDPHRLQPVSFKLLLIASVFKSIGVDLDWVPPPQFPTKVARMRVVLGVAIRQFCFC
jgi:hypothetical protein